AAEAMNTIANTLKCGDKKFLIKIDFYRGNRTQDSITWLKKFD
ncbi:36513_t:CDS:1, partial [Racocetra persica]